MAKRQRLNNTVSQLKPFAETYLANAQATVNVPKRFSGFLGAKANGYIHIYQYANNRLVGCIVLHPNNIKSLGNTIQSAAKQIDLMQIPEVVEEETIEREPDTTISE